MGSGNNSCRLRHREVKCRSKSNLNYCVRGRCLYPAACLIKVFWPEWCRCSSDWDDVHFRRPKPTLHHKARADITLTALLLGAYTANPCKILTRAQFRANCPIRQFVIPISSNTNIYNKRAISPTPILTKYQRRLWNNRRMSRSSCREVRHWSSAGYSGGGLPKNLVIYLIRRALPALMRARNFKHQNSTFEAFLLKNRYRHQLEDSVMYFYLPSAALEAAELSNDIWIWVWEPKFSSANPFTIEASDVSMKSEDNDMLRWRMHPCHLLPLLESSYTDTGVIAAVPSLASTSQHFPTLPFTSTPSGENDLAHYYFLNHLKEYWFSLFRNLFWSFRGLLPISSPSRYGHS